MSVLGQVFFLNDAALHADGNPRGINGISSTDCCPGKILAPPALWKVCQITGDSGDSRVLNEQECSEGSSRSFVRKAQSFPRKFLTLSTDFLASSCFGRYSMTTRLAALPR